MRIILINHYLPWTYIVDYNHYVIIANTISIMGYAMFCFQHALLKVFCLWIKKIFSSYSIFWLVQNICTCHVTFAKILDSDMTINLTITHNWLHHGYLSLIHILFSGNHDDCLCLVTILFLIAPKYPFFVFFLHF